MRTSLHVQLRVTLGQAWHGLMSWTPRQVLAAVLTSGAMAAAIGVATVLIPNPFFARDIPPVAWNYPIWILTSVLTGMLVATYVRATPAQRPDGGDDDGDRGDSAEPEQTARRSSRMGVAGGLLAWFAVGCPVCNKIALLALGYSGAITWFAPVQPFLAAAAVVLCAVALIWRLSGQVACTLPKNRAPTPTTTREHAGT